MNKPKRGLRLRSRTWLLLVILLAMLCATMAVAITPENYSFQVGDVATENILAVREVVDEQATALQKQDARDAVEPIYAVDSALTAGIEQSLADFFAAVDATRQTAAQYLQDYMDSHNGSAQPPSYASFLSAAQWNALMQQWPTQTDKAALGAWLIMDETAYTAAVAETTALAEAALETGVRETQLDAQKALLREQIDAIDATQDIKTLMKSALDASLAANAFYDGTATEQARMAAENEVADITYKKGQIVIRAGEVVTQNQMDMLGEMGMLAGGIVWPVFIGIFLSALAAVGVFAIYLNGNPDIERSFRKILMIALVVYGIVLFSAYLQRVYLDLVPVIFVSIVLSLTVDRTCGVTMGIITVFLCASTALAAGLGGFTVLVFLLGGWIGSYFAAHAVHRYATRSGVVGVGIVAGVVAAVLQMILSLLTAVNTQQMLFLMGMQLLSGLLSSVLCLGTTPIWESVFRALTPMKLMELCNPTNPLLRRLMYEAPGTYHHSVMVGNLAEAAADVIGANGLLARVGAYYHDVGKLAAPLFFSENQPEGMENPHDALESAESARIIIRHTHDGAHFLKEHGFAQPIIDIALQHHGNSPVYYFYQKEKERNPEVDVGDFRHTGGRPRTVEAAIVMLADCCEAATRACEEDYQKVMRCIVDQRLEDGQLDRVPITLAQLDAVLETFASVLRGAYHGRIQYPKGIAAKAGEGSETGSHAQSKSDSD